MSIPTLIVFKDGEPVDKVVGFQPKENLAEVLDKHLKNNLNIMRLGHYINVIAPSFYM